MADDGKTLAFGWKAGGKKRRQPPADLQGELVANIEGEEDQQKRAMDDWMARQKGGGGLMLEDADSLSRRMQAEGCTLAEAGKFRQAIDQWAKAIEYTPTRAVLHELCAQCSMELGETFEAVKASERAVELDPAWPAAHQTLGRVQINLGEIELAVASFRRAMELDVPPRHAGEVAKEIEESDLPEALELLAEQERVLHQAQHDFAGRLDGPPTFMRHVEGDQIFMTIIAPGGALLEPAGDIATDLLPKRP
ncbi:hypothetical protein T484DRAFT_1947859 [Baffinella frigidus]|nr:hypothetical protein T484DRAFT_1947859 [Cryptophyta sp. CCMP2293]